jgi:hypothetical protein
MARHVSGSQRENIGVESWRQWRRYQRNGSNKSEENDIEADGSQASAKAENQQQISSGIWWQLAYRRRKPSRGMAGSAKSGENVAQRQKR